MKHFYLVPTATVVANPPRGAGWHTIACPGNPTLSLVIVEHWGSFAEQDAFEALPGVVEHVVETFGALAPAALITALAPLGATTGQTIRQVFGLVRKSWPVWRD